jgi:hypothetical protein
MVFLFLNNPALIPQKQNQALFQKSGLEKFFYNFYLFYHNCNANLLLTLKIIGKSALVNPECSKCVYLFLHVLYTFGQTTIAYNQ